MDAIRSVLVHMDASRASAVRLRLGRQLAREQGAAALTAMFAVEPLMVPVALTLDTEIGADLLGRRRRIDTEKHERARATFDAAAQEPGDPAPVWAEVDGELPTEDFLQAAVYADLLVLGQYDEHDPQTHDVPDDFVEAVILGSGKPALVVPHAGDIQVTGRNVVIAWKPGREAAHAVASALPILRHAERVQVHTWGRDEFPLAKSSLGIERYLQWHGVKATLQRHADAPRDIGAALLDQAKRAGADLIVMGCYGHSRVRELVLGGATRTVLASMTVPVLMAH